MAAKGVIAEARLEAESRMGLFLEVDYFLLLWFEKYCEILKTRDHTYYDLLIDAKLLLPGIWHFDETRREFVPSREHGLYANASKLSEITVIPWQCLEDMLG